jgi:membrane protein YqaA with SNARE-associated domain
MLCGQFVDAATGAALYADALAVVAGHFQTTPPPRIVLMATGAANTYAFIAMGRAV